LSRWKETESVHRSGIIRCARREHNTRHDGVVVRPQTDSRHAHTKIERVISLDPVQRVGKFAHWSVTPRRRRRVSSAGKREAAGCEGSEAETKAVLIFKLSGIDIAEEQERAALES